MNWTTKKIDEPRAIAQIISPKAEEILFVEIQAINPERIESIGISNIKRIYKEVVIWQWKEFKIYKKVLDHIEPYGKGIVVRKPIITKMTENWAKIKIDLNDIGGLPIISGKEYAVVLKFKKNG